MTITDAIRSGIKRIRRPNWANPNAYVCLTLLPDGMAGPWSYLFDRPCQEAINCPTPQELMILGDTTDDYEEYVGSLDEEDQ